MYYVQDEVVISTVDVELYYIQYGGLQLLTRYLTAEVGGGRESGPLQGGAEQGEVAGGAGHQELT